MYMSLWHYVWTFVNVWVGKVSIPCSCWGPPSTHRRAEVALLLWRGHSRNCMKMLSRFQAEPETTASLPSAADPDDGVGDGPASELPGLACLEVGLGCRDCRGYNTAVRN